MGLGRALLLGDLGNWLDSDDNRRRAKFLERRMRSKAAVDRSQNERIEVLEQSNEELKLYVGMLVELLESKGVFTRGELADSIRVEEVETLDPSDD